MSSGSTPCGIGLPEAGPLIDALRDDSAATRLAALDALTRLPLQPDAWFEFAITSTRRWRPRDRSASM